MREALDQIKEMAETFHREVGENWSDIVEIAESALQSQQEAEPVGDQNHSEAVLNQSGLVGHLNGCPFCGESDLYVERQDLATTVVVCNSCGAFGPGGEPADDLDLRVEEELDLNPGEMEARRRWSRRASRPQPTAQVPETGIDAKGILEIAKSYYNAKHNDRDGLIGEDAVLRFASSLLSFTAAPSIEHPETEEVQ